MTTKEKKPATTEKAAVPATEKTAAPRVPTTGTARATGKTRAIDAATLARTAEISRLKLSQAEVEKFSRDLNLILDYLSTISEVGSDAEGELYYVKDDNTVLRADEAKPFDNAAGIRSQFAKKKDSGELLSPKSL